MKSVKPAVHEPVRTCVGYVEGKRCTGRCKRLLRLECYGPSHTTPDNLSNACLECCGKHKKDTLNLGFGEMPEGVVV